MDKQKLTICTVSYKSKLCLDLNWKLTANLNDKNRFVWVAVENSPLHSQEKISPSDNRFLILPGVEHKKTAEAYASYQHAAGLNKSLESVTTRFVLFLDPDFFIIRPNWISSVIEYMKNNNLSFFGAPYHPTRYTKYRYFPCGICLFVDLHRVSRSKLNFSPEINELKCVTSFNWKTLVKWVLTKNPPTTMTTISPSDLHIDMAYHALRNILLSKFNVHKIHPRLLDIISSRDVGYRIYRTFAKNKKYKYECVIPAWENPLYASKGSPIEAVKNFLICLFLPEFLSFHPKRKNYATSLTFHKFGLPNVNNFGWEEYFWENYPFGFHVRGLFQGINATDISLLKKIIKKFIN